MLTSLAAECGVNQDRTTIDRWVLKFGSEIAKRSFAQRNSEGLSWAVSNNPQLPPFEKQLGRLCADNPPIGKRPVSKSLKIHAGFEMTPKLEVIVKLGMNGCEFLQ